MLTDAATVELRGANALPSTATLWRFLAGADLGRVSKAAAVNRTMLARAWAAGAAPHGDRITIDPDATRVAVYGPGKEGSAFARLHRYLRTTGSGLLRIDKRKVAAEAKFDGKYLLRSSDPSLSAEDIALGHKQLVEVERAWREMRTTLELRPVYHRLEERIRTHVTLCWLALLLIRIAETTTGQTSGHLRPELQRLHLGTFTGPAGAYQQTTDPTETQRELLTQLDAPTPPRIQHLDTSR